uniref:Uncharacterized protein LOC104213542 n=1 Tax=Nicotiana sylvestris TaxID=4096 RepID=A0A1U7VG97_NICSY|nr:PREDICTED: uncharacterized protein LOC104213542 [Nicotiana sylvestris]
MRRRVKKFNLPLKKRMLKRKEMIVVKKKHRRMRRREKIQSPVEDENVIKERDNCCEEGGEPAEYVNVGDSDESRCDKREVTLDDFELPENFSQIVKFGELNQDETTLVHQGRTRQPGKHARSLFLPIFNSGGNTFVGPPIFQIKHPFTGIIGQNVDPELLDEFNNWLYLGTDKSSRSDCGVYVAAFAEYVNIGELSISKEDLSSIDQHRGRYGALLWDYARKKRDIGAISESEVTGILARRKGPPAANERTKLRKKKKN